MPGVDLDKSAGNHILMFMMPWNILEHNQEVTVVTNAQIGTMNPFMNTFSKPETIIFVAILMVVVMVLGVIQPIQTRNGIYVQSINVKQVLMNLPLLS